MKTRTFIVRLGSKGITAAALVEKGRNNVVMMTGNPAFTTPSPKLIDVTAACDTLDLADQAFEFNRGKMEKDARDKAFRELKALLRELGAYVQNNCKGQKDLILSAGFDVQRDKSPLGPLAAPNNVRALVTLYPGRVDLRWNAVAGRSIYQIWYTDGDPNLEAGWKPLALITKVRYSAENLVSDKVYAFRIVTIGPAGASPVSVAASAKAA